MQKVITINLNGNAYQLDESAFEMLRTYLDRAELQLKDNPDRGEIMADFEQAIADKCRKFLGPQKTVIVAAEMAQVVAEMGPVDGGDAADDLPPVHDFREFMDELPGAMRAIGRDVRIWLQSAEDWLRRIAAEL